MFTALTTLLALSHFVSPLAVPEPSPPSAKEIFQFPNPTFVENIAVRPNGNLLLTIIANNTLFSLDPSNPSIASPVTSFPQSNSLFGIAEIEPDVFAVNVGNFSLTDFKADFGSFAVWKVDLRSYKCSEKGDVLSKATTSLITAIPEAPILNGLTSLRLGSPFVLSAGSDPGVVWRVNVHTGEYKVLLRDALLEPAAGSTLPLGVNGVHVHAPYLYFTNSFLQNGLLGRVPINLLTGDATGEFEVVVSDGGVDDFAIDGRGNVYMTKLDTFEVERVSPGGEVEVVVGGPDQTIVEGVTSCAFGRGRRDERTLYVTTNGGSLGTLPATYRTGGKVVAVDLKRV
ncbi:hypothetical protein BJ875DRAFT_400677 [Amylocarpus encephaloides]|uniref:SMP-30/Gluconolactonase/LRE-like region domain-containing protein n=1 Tax=Amylocarpus encephaloides TaxID=45428 RepID=A0A9P7YK28_9HELO|nr:hypothetical protein BJ875DRAFT_400677 [Amylocarpus encephaloides]